VNAGTLDSRHAEVLAFEAGGSWTYEGMKTTVVLERFGIGMTRYYQLLNHALDLPAAAEFDPPTVARLRRIRDARLAQRSTTRGHSDVS
jgi:hypothetical protein